MTARELVLRRMLDKMTEEERRDFMLLSTRDDVLSAIEKQGERLDIISRKQSWLNDFTANITANAAWDTLTYICARLIRNIK